MRAKSEISGANKAVEFKCIVDGDWSASDPTKSRIDGGRRIQNGEFGSQNSEGRREVWAFYFDSQVLVSGFFIIHPKV